MSTTATAAIRKALKSQHGITSRQVSVRSDHSTVCCTIKDPTVKIATVEEIARPHERIDRDGYGNILRGGNTFVRVGYSDEALAPLASVIEPRLVSIEQSDNPGVIRDIEGLDVWFCTDPYGYGVSTFRAAPKGWSGDEEGNGYVAPKAFHGARHASKQIAIMLLNAA